MDSQSAFVIICCPLPESRPVLAVDARSNPTLMVARLPLEYGVLGRQNRGHQGTSE